MGMVLAVGIVALAIVLVVAFVVRQLRRVHRLQSAIDYSKVHHWPQKGDSGDDKDE